ncbi:MAG: glycosyltransferase family 39 protein, partial [bacterium]
MSLHILYFYSILRMLGYRMRDSIGGCVLLVFNPLYIFLSYTFMTEVPFCAFSIISMYYYLCGIRRDRYIDFFLGSFFATMSILTRQPGVVIVLAVLS